MLSFECRLDEAQRTRFLQLSLTQSLAQGDGSDGVDRIAQCPHCPYFETHGQHASFIFCKRRECNKLTCMVCLQECVAPADAEHRHCRC